MKYYIVAFRSYAYCLNEDQLTEFNKMKSDLESDYNICEQFSDYEISECKPIECQPSEAFIYAYGYRIPRDIYDEFLEWAGLNANMSAYEKYKVKH